MESSSTVLITGCSTGIGRATARRLAGAGFAVFATARKLESIADLAPACRLLELDVTDAESMRTAVATIEREHGHVAALVNNAGYSQSGAVESVPLAAARRQFETNFFGPVALAQLVLPGMRRAGAGRIVNLSSMGGRLVLPGGGFYHASKFALEAVSDALRFEVAGFGIHVVVIEPGIIRTDFGKTVQRQVSEHLDADHAAYGKFNQAVSDLTFDAYEGSTARWAPGADSVAATIERALRARRPRSRYVVGASARAALAARTLLPDRAWDAAVGTVYPRPKPDPNR